MQDKITPFGCATKVLRLQVLVLALGETSAPAWWRTEYLSGAGLRILERIYSRTAFAAAIHASGAAARTIHDASTGHGRIYHLFRLPIPWEREIRILLLATHGARLAEELRPALGNIDALMESLRALAMEVPEEPIGPWCIEKVATCNGLKCINGWQEPTSEASRPARKFSPTLKRTKGSHAGIQS
jgi:hypothetical protein